MIEHPRVQRDTPDATRSTDAVTVNALVLSLVHPDYLPSIYAIADVLRDSGVAVDVFCYESPAGAAALPQTATLHVQGPSSGRVWQRWMARRRLVGAADAWARANNPVVIFATCPFTYLAALRIARGLAPVVYLCYETYDVRPAQALLAPLSWWRSWLTLRKLNQASLVCVPSAERAGWLFGRSGGQRLPSVVLNCPSRRHASTPLDVDVSHLLPARFRGRPIVIHTGRVSDTQAIRELVDSVSGWPREACLVVTNLDDSEYARDVKARAERSQRRDDIQLLPAISRAHMLALQAVSSLGLFLLRETHALEAIMPAPNKVGEYLHAGLIVVGVRSAYLEMLEREGVAVIAESLDQRELARTIEQAVRLVNHGGSREHARRVAMDWYNMETQARPILRVVEAAKAARRHAPTKQAGGTPQRFAATAG